MYRIVITKTALKDIQKHTPRMRAKLHDILTHTIAADPHSGKKLLGDLDGNYSMRLNLQDRIVYSINEDQKIVYSKLAKTHYGK